MMLRDMLPAIHPGEIQRELYLEELNMSSSALARRLHVPRSRVERLVAEKASINAEMALRLGKFFRTTPEFWLGMQHSYDLKVTAAAIKNELAEIPELEAA
jgi:addiction module HigA family antidote